MTTELRVIDGIKKEKPNYLKFVFSNAYINMLKSVVKVTEETKEFKFCDLSLDT